MSGLPDAPGRSPGLLLEWDDREGAWFGRVTYVVHDGGQPVRISAWVPARHLQPLV